MPLETVVWQGLWGAIALLMAEVVRDLYHMVSHYWPPLMRLHNWHHRAYKKDFTPVSPTLYRQAQLYNDAPEAVVMTGAMVGLAISTGIYGFWLGALYGLSFLAAAVARAASLPEAKAE